ncbi:MAG: winged helix-turn-helix domain-containing protein [Candidatus Rokubacteria bacterium]|nr:winged helix-turn-helix domain-containing protein [Candidatus Rokubacteria bacterium]MBI3107055.1 winged helix-turn-helix domain-containing protein [Candidatus Rokubacteria bacterium]
MIDWWTAIDGEILGCLENHGAMSLQELGRRLGISEGEANAFVSMLVREGKLRIRQVELVPAADPGAPG